MKRPLILALSLILVASALAQSKSCCRAPYLDISAAPDPPIFTGIGNSVWPISTKSDSCQIFFNQGLRMNHCYNDFEAQRAFRKAIKCDSTCAMCYWGLAISADNKDEDKKWIVGNLKKALSLLNKNDSLYAKHLGVVSAYLKYYNISKDKKARKVFYSLMLPLTYKYFDDIELKLLTSDYIGDGYYEGEPMFYQQYRIDLIKDVLQLDSNNMAAHHYLIHALEAGNHREDALASANLLPSLAPGSPHILHMPAHIYFRLGYFARADSAFMNSYRADTAYMNCNKIAPFNDWNYIHNMVFLMADKAETGQLNEAQPWLKILASIPYVNSQKFSGRNDVDYYLEGYGHEIALRCHEWDLVIKMTDTLKNHNYGDEGFYNDFYEKVEEYARFMQAIESDDRDSALEIANRFTKDVDVRVKQGKKKYGKTDSYSSLSDMLLDYRDHAQAYIYERIGKEKSAEDLLNYLIDEERQAMEGEPPSMLASPYEWAIDHYLRVANYDKALKLVDGYGQLRKKSPFVAIYKFKVHEAMKDSLPNLKILYAETMKAIESMDHDLEIYSSVAEKATLYNR